MLALTAAGCGGSALEPGYAVSANAAVHGAGAGGSLAASGTGVAVAGAGAPLTPTSADPAGLLPAAHHGNPSALSGAGSGARTPGPGPSSANSCAGLQRETGITESTITIANASDITGPVPGIFSSAQQATRAFAAYFNSTSRLCGRKLEVLGLDTHTDAGADQRAYLTACDKAFAAVGSMAAFDSGGARTAAQCGIPDIRSQAVSDARNACSTCFGAQATELHAFQNAIPDYLIAHYPTASRHAGMVYVREAAAVETAKYTIAVEEKRGMKFAYSSSFDVAEFNYLPYVQAMKGKGVRLVQFIGSTDQSVRFAKAMQTYDFHPDAFVLDATAYNNDFLVTGGDAVEGTLVYLNFRPFEDVGSNREMTLYLQWLQQVAPGAKPSYFGLYAWSAARLFTEQARALGGGLTRAALVHRIRGVQEWTDHGLHAPQQVGPKRNSSCWRFITARHDHWVPIGGTDYLCHGSSRVG